MEIIPLKTNQKEIALVRYDHKLKSSARLLMGIKSGIVRCPANLRAFEEAGEIDRIHAFGWVGPTTNWVDLYDWEPGGGTRYTLLYGKLSDYQYLLAWRQYGTDDRWMMIPEPGYLPSRDIESKLSANESDALGILKFFDLMGHAVGYPKR